MQFVKKRENDPEYLKSVIMQKEIIIEENQRRYAQLTKSYEKLKSSFEQLQNKFIQKQQSANNQTINLNLAIQEHQSQISILKHDKQELQFSLNSTKNKVQEMERDSNSQIQRLKLDFQDQKQILNSKIVSLQKSLSDIRKYYKVEENISSDKKKIIEDSNRDLKGFSNQKQERLLILQNQQFKNELEFQSKNLTVQLDKNEKLQQQIKLLKVDIELQKQIQADLVKRSSLAQTVVKKLYLQIQELKKAKIGLQTETSSPPRSTTNRSRQQTSRQLEQQDLMKEKDQTINKLRYEIATLKNYNHYMENMQKLYSKKYETLGSIMADYLQSLLYSKETSHQAEIIESQVSLNIYELRNKDIKQWNFNQLEAVIQMLITQIKPFLSKTSLITFPQIKNVNISFVQETPKQIVSLPKLMENYEKGYEKQSKRGHSRFKDVPIDISTKILRSNLRQWGSKVKYGNMPIIKKVKSKSIVEQNQKSFI